ncbi:MAG: hypothetical protein DRQ88_01225 [Epsilonproteobacteria bacterium]|nr:MAG: hypothetical protein DRQ88_01225 [Campylobacterota bacterium]
MKGFVFFSLLCFLTRANGNDLFEKFLDSKQILIPIGYSFQKNLKNHQFNAYELARIKKIENKDIFIVQTSKRTLKVHFDDIRIYRKIEDVRSLNERDFVFIKKSQFYYKGSLIKGMKGRYIGNIHRYQGIDNRILENNHNVDNLYVRASFNEVLRGNCKYKNLIKKNRWSLKQSTMPQYSQGPIGICYAYAGIQLIDFYNRYHGNQRDFFKINKPFLGNAVYLGMKSRINRKTRGRIGALMKDDTISSGRTSDILEAGRRYGYCKDSVIQSSINRFLNNEKIKLSTREFYFLTTHFFEIFNVEAEFLKDTENLSLGAMVNRLVSKIKNIEYRETIDSIWEDYSYSKYARTSPILIENINKKSLEKLISKFLLSKDYVGFLDKVFSKCNKPENRIKFYLPRPTHLRFKKYHSNQDIMNIISNELNKINSTGLGISYCSIVLSKGTSFKGIPSGDRANPGRCGNHASIIIGQRMRAGSCQYLLRNTWGFTGCNTYNSSWECKRDGKGRESGVWIDANALASSIYGMDYFKAKNGHKDSKGKKVQKMKFDKMMEDLRNK